MKIKNIAIVCGGNSSEYEISLKSAAGVYRFIDKKRYNLYIVLVNKRWWTVKMPDGNTPAVDKNDFSFLHNGERLKFDYAYITIHGCPGEDGRFQGYLDMLEVPYSSCGVLSGALTFNKFINNQFLKSQGIRVSDSVRLLKGHSVSTEHIISELDLPVFVKPNDGGSSFGITKVKAPSEMQAAIEKAFTKGEEVIIERFIEGREVTCGCYKTKTKQIVLPVTEVITDREFFDYEAKYKGEVKEITPACISPELTYKIQQTTLRVYEIIGAHGIIRIDYIIPADNNPVLLEINTNPGMTEQSLIPQQIEAAGLDIQEVMNEIIEST